MHKLTQAVLGYLDRRLIAIFLIGISSGFPLTLVLSNLTIWMREEQVDLGSIGLFALMSTPYTLKFLWSPLVDRLRIPVLAPLFGQRRAWLFVAQAGVVLSIWGMAGTNPSTALMTMAIFAFSLSFSSATQDIVIDAWRIEILEDDQQGQGAAMINFGYRTGNLLAGVGGLLLAEAYGWSTAYSMMAFLVLAGIVAVLWVGEPAQKPTEGIQRVAALANSMDDSTRIGKLLASQMQNAVIAPFVEFMSRRGWWLILLFILIFKIGDAMLQNMMNPMLIDKAFTKTEIAYASKTIGFFALLVGTALGGVSVAWVGLYRAMLYGTIFMMITNLGFSALAVVGHSVPLLVVVVGLENFATGIGMTVFTAYLAKLCDRSFTATHYALMSSFAAVGRTFLVSPAGYLAEYAGWPLFFIIATLAALPGIAVLMWLKSYQFEPDAQPQAEGTRPTL